MNCMEHLEMKPADMADVFWDDYRKTKNVKIIESFYTSGSDCVELIGFNGEAGHKASSLRYTARSLGVNVTAICRNKRLYLVRTDVKKERLS